MNSQQKRTAKGLALIAAGGFLLLLAALFVELVAIGSGGNATISDAFWRLWDEQPWVVLLVSHLLLGPCWFLAGHFFAQSKVVYEAIRCRVDLDAALHLALEARSSLRIAQHGAGTEPAWVTVGAQLVKALEPDAGVVER